MPPWCARAGLANGSVLGWVLWAGLAAALGCPRPTAEALSPVKEAGAYVSQGSSQCSVQLVPTCSLSCSSICGRTSQLHSMP